MKYRGWLGFGVAIGLLAAVGLVLPARAQVAPPIAAYSNDFWNANQNGFINVRMPIQGAWGEVINVTPKWLVVQNELGQQFPISTDRIRQFLVRWPSSPALLTANSMIEVTGPKVGPDSIIAEHMDQFEADAQSLVTPTIADLYGLNRTRSDFIIDQPDLGTLYWMTPDEMAMPDRIHLVGTAIANDPIRVGGMGNASYTIQPSANGMTVTQVTLGSSSYARKGDLVYLVPERVGPRSLDVSQLVLYKKIPLRQFQP